MANTLPSYNLHIKEILDFLKSVTIKFSYFETFLNDTYKDSLNILTESDLSFNPEEPFVDLYRKDQIHMGVALTAQQQRDSVIFSDGSPIIDSAYIGKDIFGTNRKDIINKFTRNIVITKEDIAIGLVNINNKPIIKNIKYSYPYYINMNGEYHSLNTMMEIYSVTTEQFIDLTKENLNDDSVTRSLYLSNTSLIDSLYNKYPEQVDLIKAMFYPIVNIDEAIESENLTLLGYDSSYLHVNEKESIILSVMEFLKYMEYRWYLNTYEYENLYPLAFWSMLWYLLFSTISTKRISNIKTNQAHPYHIWEYLESKGLKGYKGFLTEEQALFLYRNINYLRRNKGKKFILRILEEVLIRPFNYLLVSKLIYHSTEGRGDYADWYPEILELSDENGLVNEIETIPMFQSILCENGFDPDTGAEYIESIEKTFSGGRDSILHTKFFEIIRASSNNFSEAFFLRYLYDTIINLYANNKLNILINLTDISGNNLSNIDISKAITLLNYCFLRCHNSIDDLMGFTIPYVYNCTTTVKQMEKPTDYPLDFYVYEDKFNSNSYMDLDEFYSSVEFPVSTINTTQELEDLALSQYSFIVNNFKKLRHGSDMVSHNCLKKQLYHVIPKFVVTCEESPFANFREFFSEYPEITSFINNKIGIEDPVKDSLKLIYEIFNAICPLTSGLLSFMEIVDNSDIFWEKIKELFISLSSYNVSYILRNRENPITFNLEYIKMHPITKERVFDKYFDGSILGCNNMEFNILSFKKIDKEISFISEYGIKSSDKVVIKNMDIDLYSSIQFRKEIVDVMKIDLETQLTID